MFRTKTTFILGAGASWHYGYPTGEELIDLVVGQASALAILFERSAMIGNGQLPDFLVDSQPVNSRSLPTIWRNGRDAARALASRLERVNPLLIDFFLTHNSSLEKMGKLAIAMAIHRREISSEREGKNINRSAQFRGGVSALAPIRQTEDDWLRFVLHKIMVGCDQSSDLHQNDVSFVTFNYDTSLERRLQSGLANTQRFEPQDIERFLTEKGRITHVYGSIGTGLEKQPIADLNLPESGSVDGDKAIAIMNYLNFAFKASLGLRTVDGPDKDENKADLALASEKILAARLIYILGYGFDDTNNRRLGLQNVFRKPTHMYDVMFTNYQGHNRVSKAAGRVMTRDSKVFVPPRSPIYQSGGSGEHVCNFEMSTKTVYAAFSEDFETLDEAKGT